MSSIKVFVAGPVRGAGVVTPYSFFAQSFNGTMAWGSQPATWTIEYVSAEGGTAPVTAGADIRAEVGPHTFWGFCKTDVDALDAKGGRKRRLQFVDYRAFLQYDDVFCAFNMVDIRIVDGVRKRRYWHIYPNDFLAQAKTFTDEPLPAATILNALFNADTVLTDWVTSYHADLLTQPAYGIDCLSGKKLGAALQDVSDKLGLVFGLQGGAYRLVWVRKGESGVLPAFPSLSNPRELGINISDNPTAVYVLGERNAYQVMNVSLLPDWARGWEEFLVFEDFVQDIYTRAVNPSTGRTYAATEGDPEGYIGWQLAMARASEMMVWEYVELRGGAQGGGADFYDPRKFHGRSRQDMPVALYLKTLLFRAFRPNLTAFTNWYGELVPVDSVEIVDRVLTDVWHNAVTGEMFWDESIPLDGNGYAIVHGYRVGEDLFRTLRPEQYQVDAFASGGRLWQHTPFQLDDSGEGVRYLIFDEPVIVSDNLFVTKDGQTVINANATLTVPSAKAALVIEAERFRETYGEGQRFHTENVGGLYREAVANNGLFYEVKFADQATASEKASEIADSLLLQQYTYKQGGFTYAGLAGYSLTDMIDRITVVVSPQSGITETVDFTTERQRNAFTPERQFDRALRTQHLLPGQEELRVQANQARLLAQAFRSSPTLRRSLGDLLGGRLGPATPLKVVFLENVPGGAAGLPAGSVLRKKPTVVVENQPNTATRCALPDAASAEHTVFEGVTVRDQEDPSYPVKVQNTGEGLARVQGPVTPGTALGLPSGAGNYLVSGASSPVATARGKIDGNEVKLIPVFFGGGGGGGEGLPVWLP